eukprot:gene16908-biopygen4796
MPRFARDQQLRFQLDSGREHPPRDMSSSKTGHSYETFRTLSQQLFFGAPKASHVSQRVGFFSGRFEAHKTFRAEQLAQATSVRTVLGQAFREELPRALFTKGAAERAG